MQIQDLLYTQGFGTRRICAGLVQQGLVAIDGRVCDDPRAQVEPEGLRFSVAGEPWTYHAPAYVMLHKPAGHECSHRPAAWPSIYTLLPAPLRQRPTKGAVAGVQAVGRLDQDTTGLLLLTDDGAFLHRMTSPRHHVPKVYEVATAEPVADAQVAALLAGVRLHDGPRPVRAAACARTGEQALRLVLTEGKYHQVKRMVAAAGNQVVGLHRSRIGGLALPADLAPGQWRWLDAEQVRQAQRADA